MNVKRQKTPQSQRKSKELLLLLLVLLVGFYFRVKSIDFGLPYSLDPGESTYLIKILNLLKHWFNPNFIEVPHFFLYLSSFFLIIVNKLLGISSIISALEVDPKTLYLPLRFVSLIFGMLTIIVVFLIGSLFNSFVGIVASALLALSFLHLKYSQLFLPHGYMTFFTLLSCFFCIKAYFSISTNLELARKLLILSTILAALSTSMNYVGFVSLAPNLLIIFLNRECFDKNYLRFCLTLFLLLFIVLNPFLIFSLINLLVFFFSSYVKSYKMYNSTSCFLYLFSFLVYGIGPVAWVSALGILKYKSYYDLNVLKILFCVPVLYFAFLCLFHLTSASYSVLLLPFFSIASALVLNLFYENYFKKDTSLMKLVFIVLFLFAFYLPFKYSKKYCQLTSLEDTRILATEWIKRNTTSDFRISWDRNSVQLNWFDQYNSKDLRELGIYPELLKNDQRFLITSSFLKSRRWFRNLRRKVDYVVVNSLDYERVLREKNPKLLEKYYRHLLKLKPIITFNPYLRGVETKIRSSLIEELYSPSSNLFERERTGPIINIYKL